MSRHLSIKDQRPRVHVAADKPSGNLTSVRYNTNGRYAKTCHNGAVIASTSSYCCDLVQDACASEDTFDDSNTYYECFPDHGYQANIKKPERTDCMYSDDSSSTKLPYYEYEDLPSRRHSRYAQSDRSYSKKAQQLCKENKLKPILIQSNGRKIYPNPSEAFDGFCQEERCITENPLALPKQLTLRGQFFQAESSGSSEVASAIVHGCGGHCQTFENVCYYFLQVAFTMGILIGASLCIAGALLRKSAARNLQVLVYIGTLLFFVCSLLLGVQCNARNSARKRRKALRNVKRTVIPLECLQSRSVPVQQPLIVENAQRNLPQTVIPNTVIVSEVQRPQIVSVGDHQGIPWWRRKDLH